MVAIATAIGGPLAVLRLSGKDLSKYCQIFGVETGQERMALYKNFFGLDSGVLLFFKGPKSFTGEDVLEFQVHGNGRICESILKKIQELGALLALPGEFSFRAFYNGKMTLSEAEALNSALSSSADSQMTKQLIALPKIAQVNTNQIFSELESFLTASRGRLESAIDFSEATEEQAEDVDSCIKTLEKLLTALDRFFSAYDNFSLSLSNPKILILGEPNSGKSTLLNLLSGAERSLVSDTAGTTRDYIESKIRFKNNVYILIDSAGIRSEVSGSDAEISSIERQGIDRALQLADDVHALLWVKPAHKNTGIKNDNSFSLEDFVSNAKKPVIKIQSFADQVTDGPPSEGLFDFRVQKNEIREFLENKISDVFSKKSDQKESIDFYVSERQARLLIDVENHVTQALQSLLTERPYELVAEDLRLADEALKKCTGRQLSDDYIGEIFKQFCLGK